MPIQSLLFEPLLFAIPAFAHILYVIVLFKYSILVYLSLHNRVCNRCAFIRICTYYIVQSPQDGHLLRLRPPGGSGYFSSDLLLLFLRYYQAVPVHVEEVEDDAMGIFQPQLPISTAFLTQILGHLEYFY